MAEMSAAMREFSRRADGGGFQLQKCATCGAVQWPPRDVCGECWTDALQWAAVSSTGVVLATITLRASMEEFFRARLPWRIGTIRLDAGPIVYAHLGGAVAEGDAVRLEARLDFRGRGVFIAQPLGGDARDSKLTELISERED
ncbi:MAG TPA: zinc ribbon domain-containing protein [Parvularculaceae bacterium]|nr:zinc ribbon domain-containing protein [Parvularculaceae bacterium]HNS85704.1 zinc ribbon domain-containing protein [Parvularculaceae bacterium]